MMSIFSQGLRVRGFPVNTDSRRTLSRLFISETKFVNNQTFLSVTSLAFFLPVLLKTKSLKAESQSFFFKQIE